MTYLEQAFQSLNDIGVFEILLPFLLIFAIVFGIMSKVKIFGEGDNKKFATIIALVMGLVAVFQHTMFRGGQFDVVDIINNALPQVSLVLVAIIMLFLILGVFGNVPKFGKDKVSGIVGVIAVLVVLYIFGSSAGFGWWSLPYWLQDYQIWSLVIVVLVFALIIKYITGDSKETKEEEKWTTHLSNFFSGKNQ